MRPVDPIEEALERLAPSFDHDLPFWEDVLLRVRGADTELGRRVRPLVIALAAVLVVAVTGTAFALERYVFVGKPAPPAVKKEFSRMNEPTRGLLLPERHRPPGVLGARARAAAVIEASTGPVYLWVAPTRSGGYCEFLEIVGNGRPDGRGNGGGNCTPKDNRLYATHRGTRVRGRFVQFVHGQTPRAARRVELRFPNGTVKKVPVRRRFFLAEIPGRIPPAGQAGPRFTVVALTSDGRVVGRQRFGRILHPPYDLDVSGRRPLLEIRTRRTKRLLRLYVLESAGQSCYRVVHASGMASGGCGPHAPVPDEIIVSPEQIGAAGDPRTMLLLHGEVGRRIASLELRFDRGPSERLPLVKGWTLYQVDPADLTAGRLPTMLVGRDSEGRVVAKERVGGP